MAISVQCPTCRELNSLKRTSCYKCGVSIPQSNRHFWARYHIGSKSVKASLGVISLKEARNIETKLAFEAKGSQPLQGIMTWGVVSEKFLDKLKAEDRSTSYVLESNRFLSRMRDYWGNIPVSDITPAMIRDFRVQLLKAGLSEASCDKHLAVGKAAVNHSVDDLPNPFRRVKLLRPDNTLVRFLTDEQRDRLLEAAKKINNNLYEILLVSLSTGLRKMNVLELKRTEADFKTGVINLIQKGGYRHSIVMNEVCYSTLANIPDNGTDYFWLSPHGTPFQRDWRRPWLRAKEEAGIPLEFRWHDLRHDTATRVYAASKDLYATSKFLGHRETRTTERYAHFLREDMERTAAMANFSVPNVSPNNENRP